LSAIVIPPLGTATIAVLRCTIARRLIDAPQSAGFADLAEALASILGPRFGAGDLVRCVVALAAARTALGTTHAWQVEDLERLAALATEEAAGCKFDAAARARSIARTVSTAAYLERVKTVEPCVHCVLLCAPRATAIMAMIRVLFA
jgi:hypothetical protein